MINIYFRFIIITASTPYDLGVTMSDELHRLKISADKWQVLCTLAELKGVEPEDLIGEYITEGLKRELGDPDFITQQIEAEKQRLLDAADAIRRGLDGGNEEP